MMADARPKIVDAFERGCQRRRLQLEVALQRKRELLAPSLATSVPTLPLGAVSTPMAMTVVSGVVVDVVVDADTVPKAEPQTQPVTSY